MKRRALSSASSNPLLLWASLAVQVCEMLFTSSQVIGHRTGRVMNAGPLPNARDCKEFALMGQEKLEAAAESMQAVHLCMLKANQHLGNLLFRQFMAGSSLLAIATPTTALWLLRPQAAFLRNSFAQCTALSSHLSSTFAHLAHQGLRPIHSRVTGNMRRLSRL